MILLGVAAMLGAIHGFHAMLVIAPLVALAIALGGFFVARQRLPQQAFTELKAQLDADVQALGPRCAHGKPSCLRIAERARTPRGYARARSPAEPSAGA